jgi:hypothetical protein
MTSRDLIINAVLIVLIGGMTYLLVTFQTTDLEQIKLTGPSRTPGAGQLTPFGTADSVGGAELPEFVKIDPFKDIVPTPTPTPPPTPPPPTPLPLQAVMGQYQIQMMDPPRTVTLVQRQPPQQTLEWKVGETKAIPLGGQSLKVKLEKIDPSDFSAQFTSEGQPPFPMKFF